ncbi:unnamed protein product [Polarella glacialis]|uniref:Cyclic nucleotide-binding domain-containing protein n=1 Tax=Polarella glacialis TaxID=89957 RepID=A0A813KDB6_POLGL|nr:unnamed protein product [Polarella glacialis]CAE8662858.1 unnamed protein product [Polarella glacialis]CAE8696113.1 unnamed protein product [Polarella glacialis]|mmetsp:Transcript_53996/g.87299  ORF Transcript_53996/g.87299 Transcript_53996/m.87299 type:complete len:411 (-) Transcript_53996:218-1450(-)
MARAAVEGLAFPDGKKEYIIDVLDPILEKMVQELLTNLPEEPTSFMIEYLKQKNSTSSGEVKFRSMADTNQALKKELESMRGFVSEVGEMVSARHQTDEKDEESAEDDDDEDEDEMPPPPPPGKMKARASVSAEAYGLWNQKKEFTAPKHPKSEDQTNRLRAILQNSFLFASLDAKDMDTTLLAMKEVQFEAGQKIIQEGDDGEVLFVIEAGAPVCKKLIDGEDKVVKQCGPGDVFGELALLYNCPRAASVEATDASTCWQLDRDTFNSIVKEAATKKTATYVDFLKGVSLFFTLDDYQRSQISDALKQETFEKDAFIVQQGEQGNNFYIVEEGSLVALKSKNGGEKAVVMKYGVGDYFGELALLKDQPRAASVQVTSDTAKLLVLDRRSFKKMLGPLQDLLGKKSSGYA